MNRMCCVCVCVRERLTSLTGFLLCRLRAAPLEDVHYGGSETESETAGHLDKDYWVQRAGEVKT